MLDKAYYEDYTKRYNKVYNYLSSLSYNKDNVVRDICNARRYSYETMSSILMEAGFIRIPKDAEVGYSVFGNLTVDLGLYSSSPGGEVGRFLLEGRFIFPVRDMVGNVIALIGWYPDAKRYITTPSALFSKAGMFFGMEQLSSTQLGKNYFLVEGIFDALSLRALGFNAIAQMGISASKEKRVLYGLFNRIVGIPDADSQGRGVVLKNAWALPKNSSYLMWHNSSTSKIKDVDDLCKNYDNSTVKEMLNEAMLDTTDRVITYQL